MKRRVVIASILLLGLAPGSRAQDVLDRQLDAVEQTLTQQGYQVDDLGPSPTFGTVTFLSGNMAGRRVGLEIVLESGVQYRIVTDPYDSVADDCDKSLEDGSQNTLLTGVWSEDRLYNVLDFTATASGGYIFVANCPDGVEGFYYEFRSMTPAGSYQLYPGAASGDMVVGFLPSGATVALNVMLERGIEYLIAGVCDQDCTDLDLTLIGDDGWRVEDDLDNDAPILRFIAPAEGVHPLKITMYACTIEPCSFAYQVFRR